MDSPRVIINADDFGLNEHCSKAIAQAFEEGLITDTTTVSPDWGLSRTEKTDIRYRWVMMMKCVTASLRL